MRFEIGRTLVSAVVGLTLATASACGGPAPDTSTGPTTSASAGDPNAACHAVMQARQTALDALAPVSTVLAQDNPSAEDIAKAIHDLRMAFTAMHLDVAVAAENTGQTPLKEQIVAYQLAIEQALVVVEGADGDKTELASAIELPALRTAEKAVLAACPR